jgi:hypothetical protein
LLTNGKIFFVGAAGVSAALVGLVIVAHFSEPAADPRASSHLVGAISSECSAGHRDIGVRLLVWLLPIWSARQIIVAYSKSRRMLRKSVIGIAIGQIKVIPFIVGGVSLIFHQENALYWIAWG